MAARTTIYLVRHAESAPSDDVLEPDWPLSSRGLAQAAALMPAMREFGIAAIYSSPYRRALHTVAPLAEALHLTISAVDALRERALGFVGREMERRDLLARHWADPRFALPGGESNVACARRVAHAIAQLALRHRGEAIAIASHGNAIAVYFSTIDPCFGFEQWQTMRNPDLFRVVYEDGEPAWDGTRLPVKLD